MPISKHDRKELVVRVCGCVSGRRKRWGCGQKIHAAVECWSSREVGQRGTAWQVLAGGLGWSGRDTWSWVAGGWCGAGLGALWWLRDRLPHRRVLADTQSAGAALHIPLLLRWLVFLDRSY